MALPGAHATLNSVAQVIIHVVQVLEGMQQDRFADAIEKLATVAEADNCRPRTRNNCPHEQQFVNGWLYPARTPRSTPSPKLATVAEADNCRRSGQLSPTHQEQVPA